MEVKGLTGNGVKMSLDCALIWVMWNLALRQIKPVSKYPSLSVSHCQCLPKVPSMEVYHERAYRLDSGCGLEVWDGAANEGTGEGLSEGCVLIHY